jgi:DNA (cytosine-5)-methyltransferase 1
MHHIDLFSGIGGFALAAERVWPDIEHTFCEIDPFCQAILRKHWPTSKIYGDIRELTAKRVFDRMATCQPNEMQNTHELLRCTNQACLSKPLPSSMGSRDKHVGKFSNDEDVNLEMREYLGQLTDSIEEQRQMDTRKMPLNTQLERVLLSEKPSVKHVETAGSLEMAVQKSKHTTQTTINPCPSCGSARDATMNGIRITKQSHVYERVDLITGGFPCQGFSTAGKRRGTSDPRYLWPEMRRVIQEFAPRYVVAENVRGILSIDGGMVFEQVCLDLEALGYEVQPLVIPACAVNAPHRRDRVWIVAHATSERSGGCAGQECGTEKRIMEQGESERGAVRREGEGCTRDHATNACGAGLQRSWENGEGFSRLVNRDGSDERAAWDENWPEVATRLCGVDDGLPSGVPRPKGWRNASLKAYGNAIVPQVAEQILRAL